MNVLNLSLGNGLGRYLDQVRQFPMLGAEQERQLAENWRDHRDPEAARMLVGSHLRLVVKIAKGFRGYGLPIEELIAEGNVGLMQAVEKFEPERGFRLATYALWWIRAMIQEYILHNWSLVKMGTTAAQKKLFFNLRGVKARMSELESGDLSPESVAAIAVTLGVSEKDVVDMNRRLSGDYSLNASVNSEDDSAEWLDFLEDEHDDQETRLGESQHLAWQRGLIEQGLEQLNERERDILAQRRFKDEPPTLEDLGRHYGVSRERVRQIEERAFQKLQKTVRELAASVNPALSFAA